MLTYSHANTPLNQSERAYYFSYFIKHGKNTIGRFGGDVAVHMQKIRDPEYKVILFLIFKPMFWFAIVTIVLERFLQTPIETILCTITVSFFTVRLLMMWDHDDGLHVFLIFVFGSLFT